MAVRGSESTSVQRPRALEAGQLRAAQRHQLGRGDGAPSTTTRAAELLAEVRDRHPEHRDVLDVRVREQDPLDLGRIDVHPAGDDQVGGAIGDVDVAVVIDPADLTEREDPGP